METTVTVKIDTECSAKAISEIVHYAIKGAFEEFKAEGKIDPMIAIKHIMSLSLKAGLIDPRTPNPLLPKEEL